MQDDLYRVANWRAIFRGFRNWFYARDTRTVTLGYAPNGAICHGFKTDFAWGRRMMIVGAADGPSLTAEDRRDARKTISSCSVGTE